MGSQNTERAGTEETLSAKPATKITRNQIVPASVDPFYDFCPPLFMDGAEKGLA
jgi:hypothetical protein